MGPPFTLTGVRVKLNNRQTDEAEQTRCRHRATEREWDMIEEAMRRLNEHERLLREVLPDLRNRLTAAEPGAAAETRLRPPLCCREPGRLFP
jgi:hypothetical protein